MTYGLFVLLFFYYGKYRFDYIYRYLVYWSLKCILLYFFLRVINIINFNIWKYNFLYDIENKIYFFLLS